MSEPSFSTLYIELDCLVDTRLTTLFSFGDEAMNHAFNENYYTRQQDRFPGIDHVEFAKRYQERNKNVLEGAMGTALVQFVKEFVTETNAQVLTTPHHLIPKVLINTYPYVLDDKEANILLQSFIALTDGKCDVEVIFETMENLTPRHVKKNYAVMVMYEYYKWIEFHSASGAFKTVSCPEVSLIGPALYFKELPSLVEMKESKDMKITPFKAIEMLAGPLVNLKLLPIESFCMALKMKRAK